MIRYSKTQSRLPTYSVSGAVSTGATSKAGSTSRYTASRTATKSEHTNVTTSGSYAEARPLCIQCQSKADAVIGDVYYCAYHALRKQKGG